MFSSKQGDLSRGVASLQNTEPDSSTFSELSSYYSQILIACEQPEARGHIHFFLFCSQFLAQDSNGI